MKIKSIALALSFVAVSSVVANEDVIVHVGTTTVEVEVSAHEVDVTTITKNNEEVMVSVSMPEQEMTTAEVTVTPAATEEVAAVSTEEAKS